MGSVVSILSGAKGFDESGYAITGAYAACAATNYGMSFVGRYISLTVGEQSGDLTSAEAVQITENGLAILVVQHCYSAPSFTNYAAQGKTDAQTAISNLDNMVAPSGLFVYCDIEHFLTFDDGAAYAQAWGTEINASGTYKAGYYGDQTILNLITGVTWHGLWENVANMGALTGANISQGAATTLSCDTSIGIDTDAMVTGLGGFWGY